MECDVPSPPDGSSSRRSSTLEERDISSFSGGSCACKSSTLVEHSASSLVVDGSSGGHPARSCSVQAHGAIMDDSKSMVSFSYKDCSSGSSCHLRPSRHSSLSAQRGSRVYTDSDTGS